MLKLGSSWKAGDSLCNKRLRLAYYLKLFVGLSPFLGADE